MFQVNSVATRLMICASVTMSLLTGSIPQALAGPKEDEILRESARIAINVTKTEIVRGVLNRSLGNVPGTAIPAGSGIVSAVQLGLAIRDFAEADNDKQRTYASAQGGVAVAGLVNPVVGAAAQAILMGIQLAESGLAAQHQTRILEIYARIQEHLARISQIETMFATSELIVLQASLQIAVAAKEQIIASSRYLGANCQGDELYSDLSKVDACVTALVNVVGHQQILVDRLSALLKIESRYINLDAFFQEVKLDRQVVIKEASAAEENLKINTAAIDEQLRVYSRGVAAAVLQKALRDSRPTEVEKFARICLNDMRSFARRAALSELAGAPGLDPNFAAMVAALDRSALYREASYLAERGCDEIRTGNPLLYEQLEPVLSLFNKAMARLEMTLSSAPRSAK